MSYLFYKKPKQKNIFSKLKWIIIPFLLVLLCFGFLTGKADTALLKIINHVQSIPEKIQEMKRNSRYSANIKSGDEKNYLEGIPIKEILNGGNKYEVKESLLLPETDAESFVVGDILTGEIILEKNPTKELPIASVTKLMTASVALDELKETHIATVSKRATLTESSRGMLRENEKIEISDLLYPLLLVSSNDAAEVLAETFGRKYFIQSMNRRSKEIGMTNTSFDDPSGLSENNTSTARDLFRLSEYLYNNHDNVFEITKLQEYTQGGRVWKNTNRFAGTTNYEGGKTGYTSKAKRTGVALFKIPFDGYGERVIAITLLRTDNRAEDYEKILSFIKENVKYITPQQKNIQAVPEETATLTFIGDVMFDRGVKSSVKNNFSNDYSKLFENLTELKQADIAFANLEGPISENGKNVGSIYSFRFEPIIAKILKDSGIDIVSFANNHVGDWSLTAFKDTLNNLNLNGILFTGAGRDKKTASQVTIIETKGIKVGFLGFSDVGPNWIEAKENQAGQLLASDPNRLLYIQEAKKIVDILVVSYHWGDEYKSHNSRQTLLAHSSIDNGADIIIGHHSHVIQDIEIYKDKIIAYSLGNAIFDQHFSKETMEGSLLNVVISKDQIINYEEKKFEISSKFQPQKPSTVSQSNQGEVLGIFNQNNSVSISWVGDIVPGNPEKENLDDYSKLFNEVKSWLKNSDVTIGNLEGVLTVQEKSKCGLFKSKNCFAFKAKETFAEALSNAGFNIINIANNHTFDFGENGLQDTLSALKSFNITSVGEKNKITYYNKNNIKIGLVSFATDYRLNQIQDTTQLKKLIQEADTNSDIVITILHGGAEGSKYKNTKNEDEFFLNENRGNLIEAAHTAIKFGADAVFNSGPHVIRGIEFFQDKPIIYSAGNFAGYNTLFLDNETSKGLGVSIQIKKDGTFISGSTKIFDLGINGIPKPSKETEKTYWDINRLSRLDFRDSAGIIDKNGKLSWGKDQVVWKGKPIETKCPKASKENIEDIYLFNISLDKLPKNFIPKRLIEIPNQSKNICIEEETAHAFVEMQNAAKAEGISLEVTSGFRDFTIQENIFINWKKEKPFSKFLAVAPSGKSEHHLGTTIDVTSKEISLLSASQSFSKTKTYEWLKNNAYIYGFIQSYKEGNEQKTGYVAESWHWRYIGVEHAQKIKDFNIETLEEYLEKINPSS